MNGYSVRMEVKEGEIKKIMDRLTKAQETIYECYGELQELGILTVVPDDDKKKSAADESGGWQLFFFHSLDNFNNKFRSFFNKVVNIPNSGRFRSVSIAGACGELEMFYSCFNFLFIHV